MNKLKSMYETITSPWVQITTGWIMVLGSLIGWPVTAFTVAKEEPFVILSISWAALIFAGYGVVAAGHADLRTAQQDK